MKATVYISGIIGEETTLTDVIRQYKSYEDPDSIEAVIHSEGGDVEEGDSIYNYLVSLGETIPVTTITDKAYSISAKIFAAGSKRIVESKDDAIMIHFAWTKVVGGAEKLEIAAKEMRDLEREFAKFYASFLNVDEETAAALLDSETYVSGEEAVELGFATEIKAATKAVAQFSNLNEIKMKKSKGKALLDAMAAFVGLDDGAKALVLQDSNSTEIDFGDIEGEMPKVGDKATVDGDAIKDGEYIIPSMEEATIVFVDGVIAEIKPKEDEDEDGAEEGAEDGAEDGANAAEVKQISYWETEVLNESFEVGDLVEYEYDGVTYAVGAGEYKLNDGRRFITDAEGKIVIMKEKDATEGAAAEELGDGTEEEVGVIEEIAKEIEERVEAKYSDMFTKQEEELRKVKALVGSKEYSKQKGATAIGRSISKREKGGSRAAEILKAAKQ